MLAHTATCKLNYATGIYGAKMRQNAFSVGFMKPQHLLVRRRTTSASRAAAAAQTAQYPDPAFCEAVIAAFPAQGTCNAEEARVLYSADYAFLDVRSGEELDTEGKVLPKMPNVFHAPIVTFKKRYDSTLGRKVVDKAANVNFVADVERQVPNKDQGIILVCSGVPSQGKNRADEAMKKLGEAGYTRVAVLDGGYPAWSVAFTNKLERRVVGFVIASGGTSIEQSIGVSSKGSGVSGKDVNSLMRDLLMNYEQGGLYADA